MYLEEAEVEEEGPVDFGGDNDRIQRERRAKSSNK